MYTWIFSAEAWLAFATLTALEIILGIDNIIFISILVGRLPENKRNFVDTHPTIKMLALSFLIMVGFTLIAEGFGVHVPKGYIYFAMIFSVCVEMLNLRVRKRQMETVVLHKKM